ncbi:MAG: hypothetical protein EPO40_19505 [Myxococcaceae bacterium]|nr:MAG: hypothetical protein EPO40_19505 [Myxococcaceae bacterium]
MSVSSVTEILNAKSADTLVTEQLAVMAAANPPLPVTAYQPGSAALTLIEAECESLADVHTTVGELCASAFLGEAKGDWLTLRAKSTFDTDRILATYTVGSVTLACSALAGPETITPGALVISTPSGLLYRSTNTTSITVASGGTASIPMRAEGSGTDYNVSLSGATIVTPAAAGLSVSAASGVSWITSTARNEEGDDELVTRCRARWATLATAGCGTRDAYIFNLLGALRTDGTSAGVTRVGFLSPPGDGTVPIRIAGATGLLSDADRDYVRTWIATRKPITDTPSIQHAGTAAIDLSTTTVTFKAGFNTSGNRAMVRAAVRAFVDAQPMGNDLVVGMIDQEAIAAEIYRAASGLLADVDMGCGDTTVAEGYVATVDETALVFA